MLRHYLTYSTGEYQDKESGLPHLAHMACNIMFMLQKEVEHLEPPEWNPPPQEHKNNSQNTNEGSI